MRNTVISRILVPDKLLKYVYLLGGENPPFRQLQALFRMRDGYMNIQIKKITVYLIAFFRSARDKETASKCAKSKTS